jgi:hypothetical protein
MPKTIGLNEAFKIAQGILSGRADGVLSSGVSERRAESAAGVAGGTA